MNITKHRDGSLSIKVSASEANEVGLALLKRADYWRAQIGTPYPGMTQEEADHTSKLLYREAYEGGLAILNRV